MGWTTGVQLQARAGIIHFATASRPAVGAAQPPIQWELGALTQGVNRPGREADHLHVCNEEVKNTWSYTFVPPHVFMAWCLIKNRDDFIFKGTSKRVSCLCLTKY